jgi:glycerol uptake facilitator-like aquaporin
MPPSRTIIREPMAEFAGVAVFVMLGTAVDCQVVLSTNKGVASSPKGVRKLKMKVIWALMNYCRIFSPSISVGQSVSNPISY